MVKLKGPEGCQFCRRRKKQGLGPCGWHGGEKSKPNMARDHRRKQTKAGLVVTGARHRSTSGVTGGVTVTMTTAAGSPNGFVTRIRELQVAVERGREAEAELAAMREALGVA